MLAECDLVARREFKELRVRSAPYAGLASFAAFSTILEITVVPLNMNNLDNESGTLPGSFDDAASLSQSQRSNALSNKVASILSTSYVDAEIREAFKALDERHVQNTPEARRRLRVDAQKDALDCNGDIVRDFGKVAEVCAIGRLEATTN